MSACASSQRERPSNMVNTKWPTPWVEWHFISPPPSGHLISYCALATRFSYRAPSGNKVHLTVWNTGCLFVSVKYLIRRFNETRFCVYLVFPRTCYTIYPVVVFLRGRGRVFRDKRINVIFVANLVTLFSRAFIGSFSSSTWFTLNNASPYETVTWISISYMIGGFVFILIMLRPLIVCTRNVIWRVMQSLSEAITRIICHITRLSRKFTWCIISNVIGSWQVFSLTIGCCKILQIINTQFLISSAQQLHLQCMGPFSCSFQFSFQFFNMQS